MTSNKISSNDNSIIIGGNVTGSSLVIGDENIVSVEPQKASLPQSEAVNIQLELKALQNILASMNDPIATGIAKKLEQESNKSEPDKNIVAVTLETGLNYTQTLSNFAEALDKLRPHVEATVGWLGKCGYKLLPLVGLAL